MRKIQTALFFVLLEILIFTFASRVYAKTLVVSDIDDTIRSIHVRSSYLTMLDHATDPQRAFGGMSQIFKALDQAHCKIYYVSAVIEPFVMYSKFFLHFNQFPQDQNLYHREWFEDTYDFKLKRIEKIIKKEKPDQIILLGDNAEHDMAVYKQIASLHPNVITYIHKVYPENLEIDQNIYLTAADLAVSLGHYGTITARDVEGVLSEVQSDIESGNEFLRDMIWPHWGEASHQDVEQAFSVPAIEENLHELLLEIKEELFPDLIYTHAQ